VLPETLSLSFSGIVILGCSDPNAPFLGCSDPDRLRLLCDSVPFVGVQVILD
jgi:hypothetical protein